MTQESENLVIKTKTGMILMALEMSLGDAVKSVLAAEKGDDLLRQPTGQSVDDKADTLPSDRHEKVSVEKTYFREVFDIAEKTTSGTSRASAISDLREFCDSVGLFEIRNAVSHPNRAFHINYWYRAAAIASHPVINILNFSLVTDALARAEAGVLDELPEKWLNKFNQQIPNNLPRHFQHDITSLVGREKDGSILRNHILNPRANLVAVVAAGGYGKTALVLETLRTLSFDSNVFHRFDAILFISSKNERLTVNGIEKMTAPETVVEVRNELALLVEEYGNTPPIASFEDACLHAAKTRFLICLDNLETIISESPDSFNEFNAGLPPEWKVVVTSRVPVDAATVIPLKALTLGAAAEFARSYASRSSGTTIPFDQCEKIANTADRNPLAIKLTVDLIAAGRSIPEASKVAVSSVVDFSFKNLIEALSEDAVQVLECIFACDKADRAYLMEILGLDTDRVSQALRALLRTSLVSRLNNGIVEEYSLEEIVRDLVRVNPRNLQHRHNISRRLAENRKQVEASYAQQQNVDRFSVEYIDEGTSPGMRELYSKVIRLRKAHGGNFRNLRELNSVYQQFEALKTVNSENASFHRFRAQVCAALRDYQSAVKAYERVLEITPADLRARFALGFIYLNHLGEIKKAESIFESLRAEGYTNPAQASVGYANNVTAGLLYSFLFQDRYHDILNYTRDWELIPDVKIVLACFRATALHRLSTISPAGAADEVIGYINGAIAIIDELVRLAGYPEEVRKMLISMSTEIHRVLERNEANPRFDNLRSEWLEFLRFHLEGARGSSYVFDRQYAATLPRLAALSVVNNPFTSVDVTDSPVRLRKSFSADFSQLEAEGFKQVTVETPDKIWNDSTYCHAADASGNKFFVHKTTLCQPEVDFGELVKGAVLYVQSQAAPDPGHRALKVIKTYVRQVP
jgi:tetratricopeptide (TPR) repeat protein